MKKLNIFLATPRCHAQASGNRPPEASRSPGHLSSANPHAGMQEYLEGCRERYKQIVGTFPEKETALIYWTLSFILEMFQGYLEKRLATY